MSRRTAVQLFSLGYSSLVSVLPPDAPLTPGSRLARSRGKAPGIPYATDRWGGYAWQTTDIPPAAIDASGANIGLRAGGATGFLAIDVDVRDESLAALAEAEVIRVLGPAPRRIGAWPKRLLLYRAAPGEPTISRIQMHITAGTTTHLVELLATGQQFLVAGTHPVTKREYEWDSLPPAGELTQVTLADLTAAFSALRDTLDTLGISASQSGRGDEATERPQVDQDSLRGDILQVAMAASMVPNTHSVFPHRDDYIRFGYAIKAACQDDPDRGLDIYREWALRYDQGTNTEESVEADWDRMRPPFAIGAAYVFDLARQYGYSDADQDFDIEDPPPPPAQEPEVRSTAQHSDIWMAEQMVAAYSSRVRWVSEVGKWYAWTGGRWSADPAAITAYAVRTVNVIGARLDQVGGSEGEIRAAQAAKKMISTARMVSAMVQLAKVDPRIQASIREFDADPDILGVPGGRVDLRTGEMTSVDPHHLISRLARVAPRRGPKPKWDRFLEEATGGDMAMQGYLQRLAGYALTGWATEQVFDYFWGPGGNGKGVFLNTLLALWGDYADTTSTDTFTYTERDRTNTDFAKLVGKRLVVAQEIRAGKRWDEQRIKAATGGDPMPARFLYHDEFSFVPQFTLIFAGNHRPTIGQVDEAMARRIHLVPFTHKPVTPNPNLQNELRDEYPAILAWAVEGAVIWHSVGLQPPDSVRAATAEYLADEDYLQQWRDESCESTGEASSTELYLSWCDFASNRGISPGSQVTFAKRLADLQLQRKKTNACNVWVGISLKKKEN